MKGMGREQKEIDRYASRQNSGVGGLLLMIILLLHTQGGGTSSLLVLGCRNRKVGIVMRCF
jgi:hypothetical protein